MTEFEKLLIQEVQHLRTLAQAHTVWNDFHIDIEVRGRVHGGELKIEFTVGESYGSGTATGNSLRAAQEEFLRRKNWDEKHRPLMISYTGEKEEDEIF
jgi:hypothetical protein